jgi:hypothetical protein
VGFLATVVPTVGLFPQDVLSEPGCRYLLLLYAGQLTGAPVQKDSICISMLSLSTPLPFSFTSLRKEAIQSRVDH